MSTSTLYPNISPSLNLDFSNSEVLDPRITFTRASTATYYDGVTTAKAEENLILRSEEFDNAAWVKLNSTITANTVIAPDGVLTGDRFVENSAAAVRSVNQTSTTVASTTYTLSVFAKEVPTSAKRYLRLALNTVASTTLWAAATYDLSLGTVLGTNAAGGGTVTSTSITAVGNGWYRCVLTGDIGSNTDMNVVISCNPSIGTYTNRGRESYTGDGDSGIYIWGAQLEQRSVVTSYTATTTQPITNYIPVLLSATNNVPRFDHNPTTGESLGLLIEEQRTNLLTYSEQFDNASWGKNDVTVDSNLTISPSGELTADKIVENTANNIHYISKSSTGITQGNSQTFSFYVKAAERTIIRFENIQGAGRRVFVDLLTGTITNATSIGTGGLDSFSESVINVGNGWWRIISTIDPTVGASSSGMTIMLVISGTNITYTGDGSSGVFVWGAQLEAGAFPTSYIATVAATATRIADTATMTGTNFSSWYNQSEGTLFTEFAWVGLRSVAGQRILVVDNGTTTNYWGMVGTSTNAMQNPVVVNGVTEAANGTPATTYSVNTYYKQTVAIAVNNTVAAINGAAGTTDTVALVPTVNTLRLCASSAGVGENIRIRRIAYYPLRLTNAQLQALTT